jgi:hypothetical protein
MNIYTKTVSSVKFFFILVFITSSSIWAKESNSQASELQASGSIVVFKDKVDSQNRVSFLKAGENILVMLESEFAYGFTDNFGIDIDTYWVLYFLKNNKVSHGISDMFLFLTWNFTLQETFLTTLKVGFKAPTGDPQSNPPTGTGSIDFTAEFDVNHTSENWNYSFRSNMLLAGHYRGIKNGNAFYFEIDFGRHFQRKNEHHFFLLWELVTEYAQQDIFNDIVDETSGGFLLRTGPRFAWQKDDFIQIQVHLNVPAGQVPNRLQKYVELRSEFLFEIRF